MNIKSLIVGLLTTIISFFFWSKIIPKAYALIIRDNTLGTNTTNNLTTPFPSISPSPFSSSSISSVPSIEPTMTPKPKASLSPTPKTTASPSPSIIPITMTQLDEWFTKYANKESINKDLLKKIAYCESKYKPEATNGPYGGMYQFTKNTWISTRSSMNLNTNPDLRYDAEEAIKTAAFRIATQGPNAWPNCSK